MKTKLNLSKKVLFLINRLLKEKNEKNIADFQFDHEVI